MKIKVKEITLELAEGPHHLTGKPVTVGTWDEANAALLRWKIELFPTSKPRGGYYKCDFKILFESGDTYNGRYDIDGDEPCNLALHVFRFNGYLSGRRKRADQTAEQYARSLAWLDKTGEHRVNAANLLDNYDLNGYGLESTAVAV